MNITTRTLSNGLRVVLVPQQEAVTVTMLTLIGTGSNKETERQNGLSHFLEHVCFKGTPTRPTARAINEAFEQIGAITNAFTADEYTGYYAKSHPRHGTALVEMVGDIVVNATIPALEIEKEKGVIVEEINMYEDMPHAKVLERLTALLYGQTPAGRGVIGTKESVRAFTRADIVRYKRAHYSARNTVVAVVGAFDEKAILQSLKKTFAEYPSGEKGVYRPVTVKRSGPRITLTQKPIDQTHIAIAVPSVPLGHPDGATITLLATILGGGMSSQLFHTLREELGVAYYVRAEHDAHSTHGEFVITAGIDTLRVQEVLLTIKAILKNIQSVEVSEAELSKAREYTIGMLGMGLEATDSVAGFVATQSLLKGEIRTPEKMTKDYLRVTPADIKRMARALFSDTKMRLAAVGPSTDQSAFEALFSKL